MVLSQFHAPLNKENESATGASVCYGHILVCFVFGKWPFRGIVPIPLTRTTGSLLLPPPTALSFIFTILQTNWYLLVFRYTRTKCCSRKGTSLHTLFYLQQKCWPVHGKACIVHGFILKNWTFQRGCRL